MIVNKNREIVSCDKPSTFGDYTNSSNVYNNGLPPTSAMFTIKENDNWKK